MITGTVFIQKVNFQYYKHIPYFSVYSLKMKNRFKNFFRSMGNGFLFLFFIFFKVIFLDPAPYLFTLSGFGSVKFLFVSESVSWYDMDPYQILRIRITVLIVDQLRGCYIQ